MEMKAPNRACRSPLAPIFLVPMLQRIALRRARFKDTPGMCVEVYGGGGYVANAFSRARYTISEYSAAGVRRTRDWLRRSDAAGRPDPIIFQRKFILWPSRIASIMIPLCGKVEFKLVGCRGSIKRQRMTEPLYPARIVAIEYEAEEILSFTLQPIGDHPTYDVDPGSHVDVHLPNGMMRSYSLSNGRDQRRGLRLTVARDANSRGGSTYMHDALRAGQVIEISAPRNNFALAQQAPLSVFIAGGIGVTPFIPMMVRLNQLGRRWRIHYCVRDRSRAALIGEIEQLASDGLGELLPNYDDTDGILDLAGTLSTLERNAHVYCCGPAGMLDAFRGVTAATGISPDQVHFEYFNADVESATEGGFVVVLNKSGQEIPVQAGETILQALIKSGLDIPYSCEEGVCGACETRVINGEPDHRDMVLTDQEREASKTMMICCSGSKSARLVLDL